MEKGPQLKVSSNRLMKPGIVPVAPALQGKCFINYTTAAAMAYCKAGLAPMNLRPTLPRVKLYNSTWLSFQRRVETLFHLYIEAVHVYQGNDSLHSSYMAFTSFNEKRPETRNDYMAMMANCKAGLAPMDLPTTLPRVILYNCTWLSFQRRVESLFHLYIETVHVH